MSNTSPSMANDTGSAQPKNPDPSEARNQRNEELCRICFEEFTDRSLTDSCYHPFCLNCLREWSQTHNICPFCRRGFHNILANVDSQNLFDVIPIPRQLFFLVPMPQEWTTTDILIHQLSGNHQRFEDDYQTYLQLMNSLNELDPNSMEYLRVMQTIFTLEGQMADNRERIYGIRQHLYTQLLPIITGRQNPNLFQPIEQQINGQPIEEHNQNENVDNDSVDSDGSDSSHGSQGSQNSDDEDHIDGN